MTHNCVISHAEPGMAFSRDELINARNLYEGKIIQALTWTDNGSSMPGSARAIIQNLTGITDEKKLDDFSYLGGHRPVLENYSLRQNGTYVQIHNPLKQNIALIYKDRSLLGKV